MSPRGGLDFNGLMYIYSSGARNIDTHLAALRMRPLTVLEQRKTRMIFNLFAARCNERITMDELTLLMRAVSPSVKFEDRQVAMLIKARHPLLPAMQTGHLRLEHTSNSHLLTNLSQPCTPIDSENRWCRWSTASTQLLLTLMA